MLAHMPAAMTVIGSRAWGLILYPDLCMCHTLDHFLDNAEERLRNYLPAVTTVVEKERSTTEFELIIAGYSERHDRMVCFVIGNHQKSELSKPWKLIAWISCRGWYGRRSIAAWERAPARRQSRDPS
jgi:hypothetical protein